MDVPTLLLLVAASLLGSFVYDLLKDGINAVSDWHEVRKWRRERARLEREEAEDNYRAVLAFGELPEDMI